MKDLDEVQHADPADWAARSQADLRNGRRGDRDLGGDRTGCRRHELLVRLGEEVVAGGTEPAVVADLGESLGQEMLQKAAQEREDVEGAPLDGALAAVAVAEGDLALSAKRSRRLFTIAMRNT